VIGRPPVAPAERFWPKVSRGADNECWEWLAYRDRDGYGQFNDGTTQTSAHRFAYRLLVGAIPRELVIDHLCENRGCVNPAHMELVPPRVNALRGSRTLAAIAEAKTHCVHGHRFSPENTGRDGRGARVCRACRRVNSRRWYERQRAERLRPLAQG